MDTHRHPSEKPHPSPFFYLLVGAILTIVTAIEVWAFYWNLSPSVLVPIFIILSLLKFAMVVLFYMHIRYDHKLFGSFILGGVLLALGVGLGFIALFNNFDIGDPNVAHAGPKPTPTPTTAPAVPTATVEPEHTDSEDPMPTSTVEGVETPEPSKPQTVPELDGPQVFIGKGCGGCHTIEGLPGAMGQVGPDLTRIGSVATGRESGLTAATYIQQSIEDPMAYVVEGFQPVMPQLRGAMTDEEFEALVDYLLDLQ